MRTIAKLFGRSPFGPLQAHIDCVSRCVAKLGESLDAFDAGDSAKVDALAAEVTALEHQADQVKNDIRNHLPKTLFLPVDRHTLLEIISLQDGIADCAEDVAGLLSFKTMACPAWLREDLTALRVKNFAAVELVGRIVHELDELLEYSFGGPEAEKVKQLVDQVALLEHEADIIFRRLLKNFYTHESELSFVTFDLWQRITSRLSDLSNISEKLANRIRMMLERK